MNDIRSLPLALQASPQSWSHLAWPAGGLGKPASWIVVVDHLDVGMERTSHAGVPVRTEMVEPALDGSSTVLLRAWSLS